MTMKWTPTKTGRQTDKPKGEFTGCCALITEKDDGVHRFPGDVELTGNCPSDRLGAVSKSPPRERAAPLGESPATGNEIMDTGTTKAFIPLTALAEATSSLDIFRLRWFLEREGRHVDPSADRRELTAMLQRVLHEHRMTLDDVPNLISLLRESADFRRDYAATIACLSQPVA